ncbi:hypothetical protein [Lederbergia galactosidilytica]|uniref:Glycerophosphoryl diester phosphodiesterase membrane domain-containing protein n=1 Tax=Lederbergia galactosidilytica TaxID=217031 RepID=A0A0Q9XN08_9BACI|nr:hypothetical protein [Lederbergia galactosidilytica]KRG09680.1 hypothetical protein ACA29_20720 [Lederbergia galactosidilytica]KRG12036.1 hypothetical protein ACA30_20570 [Virgibacillus soli]MBP1913499.1 hypothetical protein [Lederbergia galactosidilytica]OAK72180.1 hypothetical protein ABB05_09075 [Lederbergia galactosidilytica]
MDTKFNSPKGFGRILDHSFSLGKSNFAQFFTVFLIFMGPIFLLQAFIKLISGAAFFKGSGEGEFWFEQTIMSYEDTPANVLADLGIGLVSFISVFLYPLAFGAIMLMINHIRKNETYTLGQVLKEVFPRYGYLLASSFLFGLISFGSFFVPIFFISIVGIVGGLIHPVVGVILAILLILGMFVGVGYLLTRWSFYFGPVILGEETLGFSKSWKMTKSRVWALLGLYIVFFLIISSIVYSVEISLMLLLGNSVVVTLITGVVSLFTSMIFAVGYSVMYFDLKLRFEAEDLKSLISEYNVRP